MRFVAQLGMLFLIRVSPSDLLLFVVVVFLHAFPGLVGQRLGQRTESSRAGRHPGH